MALKLNNVTVSFGGKRVLDDVSLTLPKCGLVIFEGPSGCGKTTLLRVLLGLQKYKGSVTYDRDTRFSAAFQEPNLLPWLTAVENVAVVSDNDENAFTKAADLLGQLGFSDEDKAKLPDELSVGMKRRVSAARSLMIESDVLVLDEPFSGLDEENARIAAKLLLADKDKRLIILVTHVGEFSADVAAVYRIKDGKIVLSEGKKCPV